MSRVTLNRRLVLEAPQRVPDGAGGYAETWAEIGTLWADLRARTGREISDGAVHLSTAAYRITVRAAPHGAPSRPRPDQRFRDGQRVFRIEAVTESDPLGRFLTCHAQEEVGA